MFNSIILKINILSFMTGFLSEILSVHPQSPAVTAPVGHAVRLRFAAPAPALLRSPSGDLADAPVRP